MEDTLVEKGSWRVLIQEIQWQLMGDTDTRRG
jgi:hypothetical protein